VTEPKIRVDTDASTLVDKVARSELPRILIAVCTYQRNVELRTLLTELIEVAKLARSLCRVGAVVVDDNADRLAEPVVAELAGRFELGITYAVSGHRNIAIARNVGLETAMPGADWIVMTDDDCVPDRRWVAELIACQRRTGADAVSGRFVRRAPPDAPRWIRQQGVLDHGVTTYPRDSEISIASTHNSMISTAWLRRHPDVRFDPDYGRVGGEDMVFFRTARAQGLHIRYTPDAVVFEDEPPERLSFRYLVWQATWLGNSTFVTNVEGQHASRSRMAVHGCAQVARGLLHPFVRLVKRQRPAFRYGVTQAAGGFGTLLGAFGVRLRHH
jgi:succinoglycan biosynthesis protein ExoM